MRKIIFLLAVVGCSCTSNYDNFNNKLIELDPFQKSASQFLCDSITSEFDYLKLETPDYVKLGTIEKIVFSKNRIFISDASMQNSVYIFDLFGQYVAHLVGGYQGPGEFIRPMSITTDYDSDCLYVFDDKLRKIIHYDSEGEFIDEITFKYTACDIAHLNEETFSFNSGYPTISNNVNGNDLIYVSNKGKVTETFLPLRDWRIKTYFNKFNTFLEYKDTVWYSPVYNDTIYLLNESGPKPVFRFKMGDKFVDDNLAYIIDVEDKEMEYTPAISSFVINKNCVYMDFTVVDKHNSNRISNMCFFDLGSKNLVSGEFLSSTNLTGGLFRPPIATDGEYFVSWIDAYQAKSSLERRINKSEIFPEKWKKLFYNLSETDNPILLFYKVAPF